MASSNPGRTTNTSATAFTGLSRPISITPDSPGGVNYMLPAETPYLSRKTVDITPQGRTGPYGPGDKMLIMLPAGGSCGYGDLCTSGKLHFKVQVSADTTQSDKVPIWAMSKVTGQGMIRRVQLYQQSNLILEDMRYYNFIQQYLGKPACQSAESVFAETKTTELDISRLVSATVSLYENSGNGGHLILNGASQGLGGTGSNWIANQPPVLDVALTLNIGFFSEPVLMPFPHMKANLWIEIEWAPYAEAFFDFRMSPGQYLGMAALEAESRGHAQYAGKETVINPRLEPPTSDSMSGANYLTGPMFTSQTNGTYVVTNVSYRYEEVTVNEELSARVYAKIQSAEGLLFHFDSFLYDQVQWTGSQVVLDFADICLSMKSLFVLSFEDGAQVDSYACPMPWFPGFESAQFEVATDLWPKRPMTTTLELFDAFNSALGVQQSRLNSRLLTADDEFTLASSQTHNGTKYTFNASIAVGSQPYYIAPIHNTSRQNMLVMNAIPTAKALPSVAGTYATSGGYINTASRANGVPLYVGWGNAQLSGGATTVTLTSANGSYYGQDNPLLFNQSGTLDTAQIGSQIFLQRIYAPSSTAITMTNAGALSVINVVSTGGTQTFDIQSSNSGDSGQVSFVILPRSSAQPRAILLAGSYAPALTGAVNYAPSLNPINLFQACVTTSPSLTNWTAFPNSSGGFSVDDVDAPYSGNAQPMFYASLPPQLQPGAGYVAYNVTLGANNFVPNLTLQCADAVIPLPPGLVFAPGSAGLLRLTNGQTNPLLKGTTSTWAAKIGIYADTSAGTAAIRLPLGSYNASGMATFSLLLMQAATYTAEGMYVLGGSNIAATTAASYIEKFNFVRGAYPLTWGPGRYITRGGINNDVDSTVVVPTKFWAHEYMPIAMGFDADHNPYNISGLNLNPGKHVLVHLTRNPEANNGISKAFALDSQPGNLSYTGASIVNAGGWPNMISRALILHDRTTRLRQGLFDDIKK